MGSRLAQALTKRRLQQYPLFFSQELRWGPLPPETAPRGFVPEAGRDAQAHRLGEAPDQLVARPFAGNSGRVRQIRLHRLRADLRVPQAAVGKRLSAGVREGSVEAAEMSSQRKATPRDKEPA